MRKEVDLGDRKVTVVGTAHVSKESRQEVRETIEEVQPDLIGVELDEDRLKSLKEDSGWKELDLSEAIKDGKAPLLFLNLLLSIYQRSLGIKEGVKPGEEMLEAITSAEVKDIEYALLDRNINETLSRAFSQLTIREKFTLLASVFSSGEELEVEELKQENVLNRLVKDLKDDYPTLNRVFLEERNSFMAEKLREGEFEHAVVVLGAAHVDGFIEDLKSGKKHEEEEFKSFPWTKILSYGLPAFIIAGLLYSFYQIGFSAGVNATGFWILSNGLLAMLGAIISRSHVSTWIVSFLTAPLTSLDPALGAGMVAAYFEGKFYPPSVEEMEEVTKLENYGDLWNNQAGRILLTFFFVSLGSALATFISAVYVGKVIGL